MTEELLRFYELFFPSKEHRVVKGGKNKYQGEFHKTSKSIWEKNERKLIGIYIYIYNERPKRKQL